MCLCLVGLFIVNQKNDTGCFNHTDKRPITWTGEEKVELKKTTNSYKKG